VSTFLQLLTEKGNLFNYIITSPRNVLHTLKPEDHLNLYLAPVDTYIITLYVHFI